MKYSKSLFNYSVPNRGQNSRWPDELTDSKNGGGHFEEDLCHWISYDRVYSHSRCVHFIIGTPFTASFLLPGAEIRLNSAGGTRHLKIWDHVGPTHAVRGIRNLILLEWFKPLTFGWEGSWTDRTGKVECLWHFRMFLSRFQQMLLSAQRNWSDTASRIPLKSLP